MVNFYPWLLLALNASVIIISLSRSFWIGVIAGLITLLGILITSKTRLKLLLNISGKIIGTFIFGALLIIVAARFPLPRPSPLDLSTAAKARLEYEAAASSRWNLLPPLWEAIKKHPVLGSGFGTTVTYISNDPRVRETSPTGQYTTYAFEWGWLDLWLKLGTIGLIFYFGLLYQLFYGLYRRIKSNPLYLAGIAGFVALVVINFFTPYLNHPLGFGFLIILSIILAYNE
jgi:O-antigen ligase